MQKNLEENQQIKCLIKHNEINSHNVTKYHRRSIAIAKHNKGNTASTNVANTVHETYKIEYAALLRG